MNASADTHSAPVHIGAFDVVTAYGWGINTLWQGLLAANTAIAPTDRFADADFAINLAATVPDLEVTDESSRVWTILKRLLAPLANTLDINTPLILATTVGEIEYIEKAAVSGNTDLSLAAQANPNVLLGRVKKLLGLQGNAWVMSSACASSTAAISMAAAIVAQRQATQVLVVAADALSEFVYSGFCALSSLSETPAAPFDVARTGLSLGEAAAWMLVTANNKSSSLDKTTTLIAGWGSSSDASHMTAPDPTGAGLNRAVWLACDMAACKPSDVAFVAAHGTATQYSDAMEMAAVNTLMSRPCPVFSIKGGIGHTLGAAGITQLLVAHMALQHRLVPPTVGLQTPDSDAKSSVANQRVALPASSDRPLFALSTNSGFGGVNSAIVLRQGGR